MGKTRHGIIFICEKYFIGEDNKYFNYGNHTRDFTYIDDIVSSVCKLIFKIPKNKKNNFKDPSTSTAPFEILNIGNNSPTKLMDYIDEIEKQLGKKAIKNFLPIQKGDKGPHLQVKNYLK